MIVVSRQSAVGSGSSMGATSLLNSKYSIIDAVRTTNDYRLAAAVLPTADCRLPAEGGVILIALLWILTALSVIALSFSRESYVEVAAARNSQALEDAYFVARAGIDSTIYQMKIRKMPLLRSAGQSAPDPIELGIVTGTLNGGTFQVDIQDESGKLSLNRVPEEQLRRLVEAIGIGKEDGDIIVDSILDWRDADKMYRLNGAEDDYYATLDPPYKARNGRFETTEELLLVRGVTSEYFYGYPERTPEGDVVYKYGLSRCLTAYSESNQVNVNYAPIPVLMAIPGMTPEAAQAIYERRKISPFKGQADIARDLPGSLPPTAVSLLITQPPSGIYMLNASAQSSRSKARRVIRAVVNPDQAGENSPYQILYWNENVPDYEGIKP